MAVPSRALGDHLAENICLLGLLAATCGKIGREIYTLMKTEFGEVEEPVPPGTVGSSTMPQKRNPKLCQDIIAAAAEVRALVPLALEAMQTEHEADRTTSLMMDAAEARACIATGDMLARLGEVMRGLQVDPERMRANLDLGGGLIMAEAVMLDLGAAIGRQHAHDVVYDAAQAAFVEGQVVLRSARRRQARDGAHGRQGDRQAARSDRLYRPVRRDGPRCRLSRPRRGPGIATGESMSTIDESALKAMLARAGLPHSPEQVRAILPGAEIVQRMVARVNAPLPREAEPALTFDVEQK